MVADTALTQRKNGSTALFPIVIVRETRWCGLGQSGGCHWVATTTDRQAALSVEGLAKCGHGQILMTTDLLIQEFFLSWEITTTVEIQIGILLESGASLLTLTRSGSTALFQDVNKPVKRVFHWESVIPET